MTAAQTHPAGAPLAADSAAHRTESAAPAGTALPAPEAAQTAPAATSAPAGSPAMNPVVAPAGAPAVTSAATSGASEAAAAVTPAMTPAAAPAPSAGTDTLPADTVLDTPAFAWPGSPETAAAPPAWRDTTAAAVFGTQSLAEVPARIPAAEAPSLTGNAVFQGFVLLLAATYAMLLYRNLGDVSTLLGRISRDTATGERLSEEPSNSGFSRFLNIATTIGMLFLGVVFVKYGDSLMPRQLGELLSQGAVLALSLLATLACCGVVVYQMAAVRLAGAVTLSQPFVSQLVLLKRTYFSLAVIVTSPPLLLFALCPRGTGGIWFCLVAIELAVAAILYLRESLNLFLSKKISILHWFLYLCAVEVFPISLLWLLAVR